MPYLYKWTFISTKLLYQVVEFHDLLTIIKVESYIKRVSNV